MNETQLAQLQNIKQSIENVASPKIVLLLYGFIILYSTVGAIVLMYHWTKYRSENKLIKAVIVIFPIIILIILIYMGISVFNITNFPNY
jgi:heme/copper-type cytochrome/quinol oxidase subunit 2